MIRRMTTIAVVIACGWAVSARAADPAEAEMKSDVVLRAMVDELERNHAGLKLEGTETPYLIQFAVNDSARAYAAAELGAVTYRNEGRGRSLETDVRVGSYQLDNSNFGGGGYYGGSGAALPIEDDYTAIRQALWWAADRDYKGVVEQMAQKKALMESKLIKDKPDDLTRVEPTVYFEPAAVVKVELPQLEALALAVSSVFRDYPDVQDSGVMVGASSGNRYLVNTEGTRIRTASVQFVVSANATVQADDGMKLSDSFIVYERKFGDLPAADELKARCRKMVDRLLAIKGAPVLSSYTGPVLFDAEAATEIFSWQFGSQFGGGQRPVGSGTSPDDFANKLGDRILPKFLSVVDDPSPKEIDGRPVLGHYVYDDQGVKAQKVMLIEDGRLQTLLMSRNPSKEIQGSNGHGRGSSAVTNGSVGCLIVTADPAQDEAGLRKDLLEACSDEKLEFGLRIAHLGSVGGGYGYYGGGGSTPLATYKVFPDGREELVRGVEFGNIDLKAFKRMLAAGDKPYVNNTGGRNGETVVAPAMLFEELDLAKIDRDFDKPPILPSPLARKEQ